MPELPEATATSTLVIMGRLMGTYSGWDGDENEMVFYDFEPTDSVAVILKERPNNDLSINYETGLFSWYDENGIPLETRDAVTILSQLPIYEKPDPK